MIRILGTDVSERSVRLSLIHNVVEIVTMVGWLALAQNHHFILSLVVLIPGLTVEHILALAAGKQA